MVACSVVDEVLRKDYYISDFVVMSSYVGHGISMLWLFLNDGLDFLRRS